MLQVILGVIWCISDFQKHCVSKTAGLRVQDISRSLCYPVLYGHCLPSCQAEHQAPGLLVALPIAEHSLHYFEIFQILYENLTFLRETLLTGCFIGISFVKSCKSLGFSKL